MSLEVSAVVRERDVEVSFTVGDGETVAILGPNGAGKSTVLSVVAGLLRPDVGHVALDGRELVDVGRSRAVTWVPPHDREVALLAQEPLLFPHLSVAGNVAFGPRSRGQGRRAAAATAARWLDELGVPQLAGRRPADLSGGQSQRIAIARALAGDPRLLLLDEPMAALDVAVAPALRQVLRRVLADRAALIVTHDPLDALVLADRVVVVDGGRVVETGSTREVLSRPRSPFAARITGLNLIAGLVEGHAVRASDGRVIAGIADIAVPEGERAVAMFRPSAVAVYREPPVGSPRNVLPAIITELEPHGDQVRVRSDTLAADVTVQAVADLALVPGDEVLFVVKASEVALYAI